MQKYILSFEQPNNCAIIALLHLKQEIVFIGELPGNAGKVMRLLISGHKYVEIAVRMEIPIGTVKTRINISRSILKLRLKDYLN